MSTGILLQLAQTLLAILLAPLLMGWVNQCRAWLQGRSAPPVTQPYRTLKKLFHKDAVIAHHASPLFRFAPYMIFACMALAAGIVPTIANDLPFSPAADVIALVGIFALARVFLALAAMDIGTAFGTLGARREMLVSFLAEPALLMVFFTASLIAQSTELPVIVAHPGAPRFRHLSQHHVRRRGVLDDLGGRKRAHPGGQPRHPPRADDDPRGDDPRVFGAPSGADRMGGSAQAVYLFSPRHRPVPALGHRRSRATRRAAAGAAGHDR